MVRLLIDNGADVSAVTDEGASPLLCAALQGAGATRYGRHKEAAESVKIAELLLDYGADVDGGTDLGNTPLIWAALRGHYEMVKLLIDRGANVNIKRGNPGDTALDLAIRENQERVIRLLRAHGARSWRR